MTGLSREVLAELVAELGPRWQARQDARLADRPRQRAVGAGARHRLVFIDRLLATLVHLRHGVTHDVLACWFGVSRSTITRAVGEVRPLLAERGCTVEGGIRLRTLADVVAHLGATGQVGLLDATEVRVRRPAAHKAGRARFVSGKARANTVKALVITDAEGRLLFCGQTRPGSIHDLTPVRQAGLVELLALTPGVTLLADAGYQGLSTQTAGAVITPRPARRKNQIQIFPAVAAAHEAERRAHASKRIRVEHGISHLKNWRALSRHLGRREDFDTILRAVAGLVSSQERAPRPEPLHRSTKALPAGTAA
ncbi:Helix-turn-helix of DDE superfamily endonuclease [Geodermatophilus amargosae]|uniref:Helix-turn-helix of DDE superfamily endonuclease n=1 Tax=Geodermatophilus amargosae TaxID=1296565 RepID=A0A1I7CGP0_9ACTN|nr:transposase [Geodermatophilus amargosae]SFT98601.1 Helix-turn-helix of DDE superfamily endonuclease [Geodermatophilus amargosae]